MTSGMWILLIIVIAVVMAGCIGDPEEDMKKQKKEGKKND